MTTSCHIKDFLLFACSFPSQLPNFPSQLPNVPTQNPNAIYPTDNKPTNNNDPNGVAVDMRFSFETEKENDNAFIWDPVRKIYIRARDQDRFSTGNTSVRFSTIRTDINILSLSSTVRPVRPLSPENINTNFINSNGMRERRGYPYKRVLNEFFSFQLLDKD